MLAFEEGGNYILETDKDVPYTYLGRLGDGHSGVVERVEDKFTGEVFARKTIRIQGRTRAGKETMFRTEVQAIRRLHTHHHFIRVFATYMTKREYGLILRPVADDGDLSDYLTTYWELKEEESENPAGSQRLQIAAMHKVFERSFGCLAGGLAFMHAKKIRHKDIKPPNILVHQGSMVFTDFGFSLDTSALTNSTTEGRPDAFTRRYSAPEVLAYDKRNSRSDVWSLGCVLLEIFSALMDFELDERRYFSAQGHIEEVHSRLHTMTVPAELAHIPKILVCMTMREASNRGSSHEAASELILRPALTCSKCWARRDKTAKEAVEADADDQSLTTSATIVGPTLSLPIPNTSDEVYQYAMTSIFEFRGLREQFGRILMNLTIAD